MEIVHINIPRKSQQFDIHIGLDDYIIPNHSNLSLHIPGGEEKPKYNKHDHLIYFSKEYEFKLRYIEFAIKPKEER